MNITQTDGSLWQRRIFVITALFLVCGVLPFVGGLAVGNFFPDWQWNHVAFHSFVESFGSLMAIAIAVFILARTDVKSRNYMLPLACSMLTMGILNGFHACVNPGVEFVWLHSTAQFAGGLFIAMVWLPKHFIRKLSVKWLPRLLAIVSVLIGVISISYPEMLPAMLVGGKFTLAAKMLNIIGGAAFLSGGIYFALRFYRNGDVTSLLFSSLCLLFGVAGITFESSVLWDTGWWMWHLMQLAAYIVALGYIAAGSVSEYRRTIQAEAILQAKCQQLSAANQQLQAHEQHLRAANQQLDTSNQQLRDSIEEIEQAKTEVDESRQHAEQALAETERMNKLMMGREKRVIEMKREVNALLGELGREPQYQSVLKDETLVLSAKAE